MSKAPHQTWPIKAIRDPIVVMAVSVFLNVTGFTLIDPVIPSLVGMYEPPSRLALFVGLIISIYAACEFVAAPVLGAFSDRFGRKPVLLISLTGSAVGYLVFGMGGAIWVLFLGRIIDGLSAGNISVIYASVADVTPPRERGQVYGMLGAVGGAGFMLGPVMGGLLGQQSPSAPLFAAAGLTAVNILWVIIAVPESLPPTARDAPKSRLSFSPFTQFSYAFSFRALRFIFVPAFLFFLAGAMMQGNISVFLMSVLRFGPLGIGLVLFLVGMLDILSQGVLASRLLPRLGEIRVARTGLFFNIIGFAALGSVALLPSIPLLIAAISLFTLGDGLFQPSSSALIANAAPADTQGRIQGANQGQQSIARMIGPLLGAASTSLSISAPYWAGAVIVAVALTAIMHRRPSHAA
ncbi:MFS transporter [Agrobacterium tumefaciens]|uniref:MFS transporter n=1 Tax=Agrobacterium tumefaciens TaxID=358 RepID=UPI001F0AED9D|nr:MFS transporter [Agrobacterium tumefaciens]